MENTYNVSHTYETNEMWTTIILVKHVKNLGTVVEYSSSIIKN